jgi:anti-sigma B factor antagonist
VDRLGEEGNGCVTESFEISEKVRSGHTVVSVVGELDVATAPDLRLRLDDAIDRALQNAVVVDLLAVTFIDSTALGVLISGLKRSQGAGGELRIVVAEPRILKIFEITGLNDVLSIFPTIEEATAA